MARLRESGMRMPHHVTRRGNRRQETFFCEDDYRARVSLLVAWCARWAGRQKRLQERSEAGGPTCVERRGLRSRRNDRRSPRRPRLVTRITPGFPIAHTEWRRNPQLVPTAGGPAEFAGAEIGAPNGGRSDGRLFFTDGSFNVNAVPLPTVLSTRMRP